MNKVCPRFHIQLLRALFLRRYVGASRVDEASNEPPSPAAPNLHPPIRDANAHHESQGAKGKE